MSTKPKKNKVNASIEKIQVGKITYLSQDKGAFVELLAEPKESAEVFVPNEILANKKLSKNKLVKLTKLGNKITDISPF